MDADTLICYKNDSSDWIFRDNDLSLSKETSKNIIDINTSEYESNVEVFGEITIQINNEIHILYDGPVQIKCTSRSQDYTFNCSNVLNKSSDVDISAITDVHRISEITTPINTNDESLPKRKSKSPTKPYLQSNVKEQVSDSLTVTYNRNSLPRTIIHVDPQKTESSRKDTCTVSSKFYVPKKTIVSEEDSVPTISNTTCIPVKCNTTKFKTTEFSVPSVNKVSVKSALNQCDIKKSIRDSFNKLIQSNISIEPIKRLADGCESPKTLCHKQIQEKIVIPTENTINKIQKESTSSQLLTANTLTNLETRNNQTSIEHIEVKRNIQTTKTKQMNKVIKDVVKQKQVPSATGKTINNKVEKSQISATTDKIINNLVKKNHKLTATDKITNNTVEKEQVLNTANKIIKLSTRLVEECQKNIKKCTIADKKNDEIQKSTNSDVEKDLQCARTLLHREINVPNKNKLSVKCDVEMSRDINFKNTIKTTEDTVTEFPRNTEINLQNISNPSIQSIDKSNNLPKNKVGIQKKVTEYFSVKNTDSEPANVSKTSNVKDITTKNKSLENEKETVSNLVTSVSTGTRNIIQSAPTKTTGPPTKDVSVEKTDEYSSFHEAIINEPSSTIINIESPLVNNNECLKNISTSVLCGNRSDQNSSESNRSIKTKENLSPFKTDKNPVEEVSSLLKKEILIGAQKENIPVTNITGLKPIDDTLNSISLSETKDIEVPATSTPVSKLCRKRPRTSESNSIISKPTRRSKRTNLVGDQNGTVEVPNVIEEETRIPITETAENPITNDDPPAPPPTINKVPQETAIKREKKLDETENIIRLDTIGTEIHTFHCNKCDVIFLRKSLLQKHEIERHPAKESDKKKTKRTKVHTCKTCSEKFPSAKALKTHECQQVPDASLKDGIGDTQETISERRVQVQVLDTDIKVMEVEEFKTDCDDTQDASGEDLDKSIKRNVCQHCKASFSSLYDLKTHVKRVHEKVKSKICPYCSRGFTCTGDLTRHIRLHTGEKPFKCKYRRCTMAFIASGDLIKHQMTHMGDKCPRKFVCDECGKSFKLKYEHKRHMQLHSSTDKPYECHLCKKQFGRKDSLSYHLRLHVGIKPYECACGKRFTDSGNLLKHMRTKRHKMLLALSKKS